MGVTLERVQFKFASIIGELCSEPDILSQFAVWVDLRLAEYKLKGAITLECDGAIPDHIWLKGILSALLKQKSKENIGKSQLSCCHHKCDCTKAYEDKHGSTCSHPSPKKCKNSDKDKHLSLSEKPRLRQPSNGNAEDSPHSQMETVKLPNGNQCVTIKVEPQADDYILVTEHNGLALVDKTKISEKGSEGIGRGNKNDSSCSEGYTPTNQSLMSIIGDTLPEADFASERSCHVQESLNVHLQNNSQNKNVELSKTAQHTFPLLNPNLAPILVQVPVSAVNMMNNQCSFVTTSSSTSGTTAIAIPVNQLSHLTSSVQPNVSPLPVPVPTKAVPLSNSIPICNTVPLRFPGHQNVQSQNPTKKTDSRAAIKRRLPVNSPSPSNSVKIINESPSQPKKQILPTERTTNFSVSESSATKAVIRQNAKTRNFASSTAGSSAQATLPKQTSNQTKPGSEVSTSSSNVSHTKGRNVGLKYPMKKRQLITKYRPILPAESGLKISSTCSLNPEAADNSPTK